MSCFVIAVVSALLGAVAGYAFRGKERKEIGVAGNAVQTEIGKIEKKL